MDTRQDFINELKERFEGEVDEPTYLAYFSQAISKYNQDCPRRQAQTWEAGDPAWAALTAYSLGDLVYSTTYNNYVYECTTAGTSGATEPAWPITLGDTKTDGTVVWTCRAGYEWTLADFEKTLSYVEYIEYPAEERIPKILKKKYWILMEADGVFKVRLLYNTPGSGEAVTIVWYTPHTVDDSSSSIPTEDEYALVDLASSYVAKFLASKYFRAVGFATEFPTPVDFGRKGEHYITLSRIWKEGYDKQIVKKVFTFDHAEEPIKEFIGLQTSI